MQLPPKRRQVISLALKKSDFDFARGVAKVVEDASTNKNSEHESLDSADKPNDDKSAGIYDLILFIPATLCDWSMWTKLLFSSVTLKDFYFAAKP